MSDGITSSTKLEDLEGFDGERIIKIQAINSDGKLGELKELKFNSTDTLETVLKRINSETDVNAFFDEFTGQIAMTAKNSGKVAGEESAEIVIDGKLADVLKLKPKKDDEEILSITDIMQLVVKTRSSHLTDLKLNVRPTHSKLTDLK